jgi:hypothetical protein
MWYLSEKKAPHSLPEYAGLLPKTSLHEGFYSKKEILSIKKSPCIGTGALS